MDPLAVGGCVLGVIRHIYEISKEVKGFQSESDELSRRVRMLQALFKKVQSAREGFPAIHWQKTTSATNRREITTSNQGQPQQVQVQSNRLQVTQPQPHYTQFQQQQQYGITPMSYPNQRVPKAWMPPDTQHGSTLRQPSQMPYSSPTINGHVDPRISATTQVCVPVAGGGRQIYQIPNNLLQSGRPLYIHGGQVNQVNVPNSHQNGSQFNSSASSSTSNGNNTATSQTPRPTSKPFPLDNLPDDSDDPQIELLRTLLEAEKFIEEIRDKGFFGKLTSKNQIRDKFSTINDRLAFLIPALILTLQAETKEDLGKNVIKMSGNSSTMNILFKTLGNWQKEQQQTALRLESELKLTHQQLDKLNKNVEDHSQQIKTQINEFEGRQEEKIEKVMTDVNTIGVACQEMPRKVATLVNKRLDGVSESLQQLRETRSIIQDTMRDNLQEILAAVKDTTQIKKPSGTDYLRMRADVMIDLHNERERMLSARDRSIRNQRRHSLHQVLETRRHSHSKTRLKGEQRSDSLPNLPGSVALTIKEESNPPSLWRHISLPDPVDDRNSEDTTAKDTDKAMNYESI